MTILMAETTYLNLFNFLFNFILVLIFTTILPIFLIPTTYLFIITYSLCFRILPIPLTFWLIDHTFTIRFYYSKIFIETIRIRFWIIASIHHIYHCLECCVAYLVYLLIYTYTIIIIIFQILYLHSFFSWALVCDWESKLKEKRRLLQVFASGCFFKA